ncbi:MAG TPA: hypothetical protein PKE46_03195 [Micropruina sp.]|nr:hypothetical protein [Micropruina sp.]HMR21121.1 hypothetical protein [Micropruina sp.]
MPHHPDPCIRSLNAEWVRLGPLPVPDAWRSQARTLGELVAGIPDDPDARLGGLLRHHAAGDELAGRVVLQAMLGKLVRLAALDARHGVGEYVTECWLLLVDYPLDRRPSRIAANLAMDTRRAVRVADERRPSVDVAQLTELSAPVRLDVSRVLRAATRLGLIDRDAGACLYAVYGLGLHSHEAALHLRISPALVRWRNARSIRRLAPHASTLVAVA